MSTAMISSKLIAISELIRLPKQYGTALLLCPTLWALFMASGGRPSIKHFVIFVLGAFLMRSAGCAVNDIADRDFDGHVERTRSRPLAQGRLKVWEASLVFTVLSLLAFTLVLFLNKLAIMLSLVAVLLAATYPFVKRVSFFPQAFLGAAFGWGGVMAWAAVKGEVGLPAILIFAANVFWSMAYDTIYALMDIEDDLRIGVKSTAIFFGEDVFTAVRVFYVAMVALLVFSGLYAGLGVGYLAGVAISMALFLIIVSALERELTMERAFRGFVANVGAGVVILAAIIIDMNL